MLPGETKAAHGTLLHPYQAYEKMAWLRVASAFATSSSNALWPASEQERAASLLVLFEATN